MKGDKQQARRPPESTTKPPPRNLLILKPENPIEVTSWLMAAKELTESNSTFMLVTIWSKTGYSPNKVGTRLLVTRDAAFGSLNSEHSQQRILHKARILLDDGHQGAVEHYPLGDILGSENGTYRVVYTRFPTTEVADWLELSCQLQKQGHRFILCQHIDTENTTEPNCKFSLFHDGQAADDPVSASALEILSTDKPPHYCELLPHQTSESLLQVIGEPMINIGVLGASRTASCLVEQLSLLPVSIHWYSTDFDASENTTAIKRPLRDSSLAALPLRTRLIIATGNHETDLHYCKLGLQSTRVSYIGCIGSAKKADLIKKHLQQHNIPPHQIDRLHIPIGLSTIDGKQPEFVAASIVAQILSYRERQ